MQQPKIKDQTTAQSGIMTLDEIVTYTGYKKSYLYQLVHKREIPACKTPKGRKLFFRKADIDKWLTSRQLATVEELTSQLMYR